MAAATQALPSAPSRNLLDDGDMSSNVSSPLSEVEDKDGETPDMAMSVNEDAIEREETDSDSNLSDVAETEAETERLFDTPRNERYRDVVVDQFNEGRVYERSPSMLRKTGNLFDDMNDDGDLSELDRPSPMSQLTINDTPTKEPSRRASPASNASHSGSRSRGLKRSRSPEQDIPVVVEPTNDRPESEDAAAGAGSQQMDEDITMADDDISSLPPPSGAQSVVGDADETNHDLEPAPLEQELVPRETRGSKKTTRSRSRRNTVGPPDDEDGSDGATNGKGHDAGSDVPHHIRQAEEADRETEAEHVDKSAVEAEKKQAAFEEWTNIDGMFGVFADRLYKDRLARLEEEERSLLADEPTHAEYLAMLRCLDERLETKLAQFKKEHEFQVGAVARVDESQRSQIWSQYYQEIRETREDTLESLNQQWYDVQATRRNAHGHTDQVILFPKDPVQRSRNAISYSAEVATLATVAKHEGFPAAPFMRGATSAETDSDLEAIRRAKRPRQTLPAAPPALDSYPATSGLLTREMGPAGEQFIRDNAWANPKHPSHKAFPPGAPRVDARSRSPFIGHHTLNPVPRPTPHGAPKPLTNGHGPGLISPSSTPHGLSESRAGANGSTHMHVSRQGRGPASPMPDLSKPGQRLPPARI